MKYKIVTLLMGLMGLFFNNSAYAQCEPNGECEKAFELCEDGWSTQINCDCKGQELWFTMEINGSNGINIDFSNIGSFDIEIFGPFKKGEADCGKMRDRWDFKERIQNYSNTFNGQDGIYYIRIFNIDYDECKPELVIKFDKKPICKGGGSVTDITNCGPYTWSVNGSTYNSSGTYYDGSNELNLVVLNLDNANFSYSQSSYCKNGSDPTPTITGLSGGAFSSTTGLSINSSTGRINLLASTSGTYVVTYQTSGPCPNNSTFTITIHDVDQSLVSSLQTYYCKDGVDPQLYISSVPSASGGSFSSNPLGLVFSSLTGKVDLSASPSGTYVINFQSNGPCPVLGSLSFNLVDLDDASFSYGSGSYCKNGSDPSPSTNVGGGTFSSTSGLSINSSSGLIDLSASTSGTYTVTHQTNGPCPSSSTQTVMINNATNVTLSYGLGSYCKNGSDPSPTTSISGGTFSSTSGLSINSSTGLIDLSTSIAGTYIVTYQISGTCTNSATQTVVIKNNDNAGFSYSSSSYCKNGSDPSPSTNVGGGTFSSTSGLSINSSTGLIDLSASSIGTYTVTYQTNGPCPNNSTQSVTINNADNASFSYGQSSYCKNGSDPSPTTSISGGTFSSTTGLSINSSSGLIDLSTSTAGTYVITYQTNSSCPNSSTKTVTINNMDNASFSYSQSNYCKTATNPSPTITGVGGGTFSSTSGLSINGSSGLINLSASTTGTYTVTYQTNGVCSGSFTRNITISPADDASFSYPQTIYCSSDNDPIPIITGLSGGTFHGSPIGIAYNPNTGIVDLSLSTDGASVNGSYYMAYTTNGACPNTFAQQIIILKSTVQSEAITSCGSFTWPVNGVTYTSSGVYSHTVNNSSNCSKSILNLTIVQPIVSSETVVECDSYTWPVNGTTYTSSGTYTFTDNGGGNCIEKTLELTIHQSTSTQESITSCDSYYWPVNSMTYFNSGTYHSTVFDPSTGTCVNKALNLTINQSPTTFETVSTCNSYTWEANTYSTSGTYTKVVSQGSGCDIVKTLYLTIINNPTINLNVTAVGSYYWALSNQTYSIGGVYSTSQFINGCSQLVNLNLTITPDPDPVPSVSTDDCETCIGSFAPEGNKRYVISAWVKEANASMTTTTYVNPGIMIYGNTALGTYSLPISTPLNPATYYMPKGLIIDGWQKIEEVFDLPIGANNISIKLLSNGGDVLFDDIRIYPFDGSMKSFVYDPITARLKAVLDELNYATFYEYDQEGNLVRIKKETERGVMTIQETRSNTSQ